MAPRIRGCYIPFDRAEHFAKRAAPEEVHEVLENTDSPPLWVRTRPIGRSPAYLVYGRTAEGRYLLIPGVVFNAEPLKDVFMPATVRPMISAEQAYYDKHRGGGKA